MDIELQIKSINKMAIDIRTRRIYLTIRFFGVKRTGREGISDNGAL